MRVISFLLLGLSALAGFTVSGGQIGIAMINAIVFLTLALAVAHLVPQRFGNSGIIYSLVGVFVLSLMWPVAALPWLIEDEVAPAPERDIYARIFPEGCPPEGCPTVEIQSRDDLETHFEENP